MKKQVSAKTMLARTVASFAVSLVFLALSITTFAWMASNRNHVSRLCAALKNACNRLASKQF
ncbi:MAG: hypothetical protein ACI4QH_04090 [Candidatus Fimimonas sp.]